MRPVVFIRNVLSRGGLRLALLILGVLSVPGISAHGQFRMVHAPEYVHTEQDVNFFIEFDSSIPFDGAYLAIPSDWELKNVSLISESGRVSVVEARPVETTTNRFHLLPPRKMSGSDQLMLGMKTGPVSAPLSYRLTPFQLRVSGFNSRLELLDAFSIRHDVVVAPARILRGNRVLQISDESTNAIILPDVELSRQSALTAEFWVKTASTDAVVMSSWDGSEASAYPFELVLDGAGHLTFFRGSPGEHRSMRSRTPVADGNWHHVAVTHDQEARWSHLYVDGSSSDSLFFQVPLVMTTDTQLALAGRVGESETDNSPPGSFRGYIDEIRFWDYARSKENIRASMRHHLGPDAEGLVSFSFETGFDDAVEDGSTQILATESDLSFYEPIQDLSVELDASSVLLEWKAIDPNVVKFLVERSADGTTYEILAEKESSSVGMIAAGESTERFRDLSISPTVAFYRIRQVFADGAETTSKAVKIGMGAENADLTGSITGNFPNPFNPTTTITYALREAGPVQVSVWDLSGQMIALLVDATRDQGSHEVQFDATDLPSGTYFVRMRTVDGVQTRQIILMK